MVHRGIEARLFFKDAFLICISYVPLYPFAHLLIMQSFSRSVRPVDLSIRPTQMPALDALAVLLAQSSEARVHFRTSGMQVRVCAIACVNGCV